MTDKYNLSMFGHISKHEPNWPSAFLDLDQMDIDCA